MDDNATADRTSAIEALLVETSAAHDVHEKADLNGVYDTAWARWYAAYAVEHGLGDLLGRTVGADALAEFLARTNIDLEQTQPKPAESWAGYTARRIANEL
jgi:hypothetical protein